MPAQSAKSKNTPLFDKFRARLESKPQDTLIYVGFALIALFFILASLAPDLSSKFGFLFLKKQLQRIFAAGPVAVEPENGTISGPVTVGSDSTASGNKYVQFGSPGTSFPSIRDAAFWPFESTSPWNYPAGSGAVFATETSGTWDPGAGAYFNSSDWSIPMYIATNSDPQRNIYEGGSLKMNRRVPDTATAAGGTDRHLNIVDPTHNYVVEIYNASKRSDGGWNGDVVIENNLKDAGVYPAYHGTRAYGGSSAGGLIRKGELAGGIYHAIAAAVERSSLNPNAPGGKSYVWPASSSDGGNGSGYTSSGNLYMGSLVAIPPTVDVNSLGVSGAALEIAKALQNYGAYIVDTAGTGSQVVFYAEPTASGEVSSVSSTQLKTVVSYLKVITNNSSSSVGGGGIPRQPFAPPFSGGSYPPPTVDIKANGSDGPITINSGTAATLSWTTANATSCTASNGWSGTKATSGSESTGNLTANKTYTLTCTGLGGSAADSVTVNIPPCSVLPTDKGVVTQTISPGAGDYKIWSRIMAPDNTNNSIYLQIDGNCGTVVGNSAISASTWTWVDYKDGNNSSKITVALSSGSHEIKLIGRESGVKLDRLILTTNFNCTPQDKGDNCLAVSPTPTPSPLPSPISPPISLDTDGDSFTDSVEIYLGTNPNLACPATTVINDENPDAWPPDFDDDQDIDVGDVILGFSQRIGSKVGDPNYSQRSDFDADGDNDDADIHLAFDGKILTKCTGVNTQLNPQELEAFQAKIDSLIQTTLTGDSQSPHITISSPTNGASVSQKVLINAMASDNIGVTRMEIYIDGSIVFTMDNVTSINYSWNIQPKKVTYGTHSIEVKAYDAAGNVGSSSVNVTK